MCEKWRDELDRRFGVDARIVGASDLLTLLRERNRTGRGFAAIASMQSLRPPRKWQPDSWATEDKAEHPGSGDSPRWQLTDVLHKATIGEPLVDLLVVDEAHHMRNPKTMLYLLGELVNAVSKYRIFLSATPIHLRNRDLNSLLRLIDPDTFEYESTLDDLILANEPIIEARDLLMRPSASREQIIECIDNGRQTRVLAKSRALQLVRDDLVERPLLDAATRAEIASRLESVNQMANYLNRTRRRDVEELRVRRKLVAPEPLAELRVRVGFSFSVSSAGQALGLIGGHWGRFLILLSCQTTESGGTTPMALREILSSYWSCFQALLFPQLEETIGALGERHQRFVMVLEWVRVETLLPYQHRRRGCPPSDRAALARAFIAKAVFALVSTRMLLDRLRHDSTLRRLCG